MEQRRNNQGEGESSRPSLTTDIADALKDNEHVTGYNYTSSSFGLAKNFENVKMKTVVMILILEKVKKNQEVCLKWQAVTLLLCQRFLFQAL